MNLLFVCSQNRLRSPTAEQIFATHPGVEVDSAGTNADAENPVTPELVRWADLIFVMEKTTAPSSSANTAPTSSTPASSASTSPTIMPSWMKR